MKITDELLEAYLDGGLPPEKRAELEALLAIDPTLRERVAFMRGVEEFSAAAMQRRAPHYLTETVMGTVRAEVRHRAEKSSNRPLYIMLALFAAFALTAVLVPSSGNSVHIPGVLTWVPDVVSWVGGIGAGVKGMFRPLTPGAPFIAGVGALLLLAVLDMYVLRPLMRRR